MPNTIYATFADPILAERAAGALLDYGVLAEDISLVQKKAGTVTHTIGTEMGVAHPGTDANFNDSADRTSTESTESVGSLGMIGSSPNGENVSQESSEVIPPPVSVNPRAIPDGTTVMNSRDDYDYNTMMVERDAIAPTGGLDTRGDAYAVGPDVPPSYNTSMVDRNLDADDLERAAKEGISTTTPADAGAGAIKGAGIGVGVGALAALVSIAVPGFGLIIGGGALAVALAGVAATAGAGAAAGAVVGYLKDQGMDQRAAEEYTQAVDGGGAIIAVHVPSGRVDESTVRSVLDKYGAANLNNFVNGSGPGYVA